MALATAKSLFLHIPKAAGIYIRNAFRTCGISCREIGEQHDHFPDLLDHFPESYYRKLFVFTFIRHPLTWYQSRWAFRVKNGWRLHHPLDFNCASNSFTTFVSQALRYEPNGWLTMECRNYIDAAPPNMIRFIGRIENLESDLRVVLDSAGETYDPKKLATVPRINESDMDGHPSSYWARYTPELIERVLSVEHEVIEKYYADLNPRILSLLSCL